MHALESGGVVFPRRDVVGVLLPRRRAKVLASAVDPVRVLVVDLWRVWQAPQAPQEAMKRDRRVCHLPVRSQSPVAGTVRCSGVHATPTRMRGRRPSLHCYRRPIGLVDDCEVALRQRDEQRAGHIRIGKKGTRSSGIPKWQHQRLKSEGPSPAPLVIVLLAQAAESRLVVYRLPATFERTRPAGWRSHEPYWPERFAESHLLGMAFTQLKLLAYPATVGTSRERTGACDHCDARNCSRRQSRGHNVRNFEFPR
jgi:hypothetical protein